MSELMVIKQLPIIEEQLFTVKPEIEKRLKEVTELECTEDNIKELKKRRAEFNKEFNRFEERRKELKNQIMTPYNDLVSVYTECIATPYKTADAVSKSKIDKYEDCIKEQKIKLVRDYFNEYAKSLDIDFVEYERCGIMPTLSSENTCTKEKNAIKAYLDRIYGELALISTQTEDMQAEIMVEYKQSLNISQAILTVTERRKAIEKEKPIQVEPAKDEIEPVEVIKEPLKAPEVIDDDPVITCKFSVTGRRSRVKDLKEYMSKGDLEYESIK